MLPYPVGQSSISDIIFHLTVTKGWVLGEKIYKRE
jgi:hypothetical protein